MTTFHKIQSLGKDFVQSILLMLGESSLTFPSNYLKQCSLVYQAFKRGNIVALEYVLMFLDVQREEQIENLEKAFTI
jgi:hypothetical protein